MSNIQAFGEKILNNLEKVIVGKRLLSLQNLFVITY